MQQSAIHNIAFPAKAGTHFSTLSGADEWIPAFVGNAIEIESPLSSTGARQLLVIGGGHAGLVARRAVEGWLQHAAEIASDAVMKGGFGIEAALMAEPVEPAQADRDMTDLVAIDSGEDCGARAIAGAFETQHHLRRHIEPAGFENERHDREAGDQIVRGGRRGFPETIMRRQRAIG